MKKHFVLTALTLLSMAALSPLVLAGPPKSHSTGRSFSSGGHSSFRSHSFKPTTFHAPIHHAPTHHDPKFIGHVKPTTFHGPIHHDFKFVGPVKPTFHAPKVVGFTYAKTFGTKFSHGYFYKGIDHKHWTKHVWAANYGTWSWYCPATTSWYYWYAPKATYYPMSYITKATPAKATQKNAVVPPGGEQLPEVPANEVEGPTE